MCYDFKNLLFKDLLYGKRGGYLQNKFRNAREKRIKETAADLSMLGSADNEHLPEVSYSEDEKQELMHFFKTCLVQDKKKLLDTLKETISFRRKIFSDENTTIADDFKFYFLSPGIVC